MYMMLDLTTQTYNTVGISSEDGSTPPVATPFSNIGFVDAIRDDNRIGSSSFTYTYGSTRTGHTPHFR